jgi:predicted Zn-dependent protease
MRDRFPDILTEPDGREIAQAIVLHEFGHLVGLDHVADETQLMNPETVVGITDFAAGDLAGLSRLGRGPCAPLV